MNKYIFSLFLFLFVTIFNSQARPIDVTTAKTKAAIFLKGKCTRNTWAATRLRETTSSAYLFETSEDFVLIAADDRLPDILGYGEKTGTALPPALRLLMKAHKHPVEHTFSNNFTPVPALLPFARHQKSPYNNLCPLYKTPEGEITDTRCVSGCVATALEEVISYYRRTLVLQDTLHGWKSDKHTDIPDILPGTNVNCKLIRNNYDTDNYTEEEAEAVARLTFYCGIAAKMKWGVSESGANVTNLIEPLKKVFGYKYVEYVDSYKYLPSDWLKMIRNELYAGRPVFYAASLMHTGGHAFVIDGLDKDGFFHVNWGYGGSYDGYYRLDLLNYNEPPQHVTPEGMDFGFFVNHRAILLHPDSVEVSLPDTLTRTGLEIAVDSVIVDLAPETGKQTPIQVYLRNTTAQTLTTPFEYFTNAAQDTAIFSQGDYIALGSATLAPYEQKKYTIHARFDVSGERILRISPDDVHCIYECPVTIAEGAAPQLTFHEPEVSFPGKDMVLVTFRISNNKQAGRSGQDVLVEMGPGDEETLKDGIRHPRYLYVQPGETQTDTVSFHSMQPGEIYTTLIRSPWKIQQAKTFVFPDVSGIGENALADTDSRIQWYTITGRRIAAPQGRGLYLRKEHNKTEKIFIR